ncbi:catabolic L-serine/threonine dehydratase [Elasticomyces elasticus]|nr:catabolic L-serine/threonine dehydratase [Elasticomyces elasticus]KAK4908442.1 catabolic L-serine/threonine dehydratase [Elasticomyces elasticus]KAK5743183.1 catabolic L-serine/threonine dehydratase [Elasticomyces elasticus]
MAADKKPTVAANKKPWCRTPLIESANLSKTAGCKILLKLENLQPAGSFKSRGIGNYNISALQHASHTEKVHFYSSSGGNAGLACVHAANFLGRPSTVVVPLSTKPMMIVKIKAAGASEVVQHGASWKEADTYLRDVVIRQAEKKGEEGVYVPPFDHEDIWAGNATLIDEVDEQMQEMSDGAPDVVVCSVGGGGLFNGVVQGVEARKDWQTTVLAMETEGAHSLAQSLAKDEHITLPGITSLATGLGATRVSERCLDLARKHRESGKVRSVVFSDAEAAMGCWRFADDERILVELACGVNTALCYGGRLEKALGRPVKKDEKVVIVVCGGQDVTAQMVEEWRQQFGDLDKDARNGHMAEVPSAATAPNGA